MTDKYVTENFITQIIDADLTSGKHTGVVTRFPPEPNGYLHIGHAKSICLNFGVAADYNGTCHLRFDDTNPEKESAEYAKAIQEDVKWLGFNWGEHQHNASDYFQQLYDYAVELIHKGLAYVDDQSIEEIREHRGDFNTPGKNSPYRDRSTDENLDLFERMKGGEFEDGSKVLRAKIDMASGNINMRDPVIYRIRRINHIHTGDTWCIYPMYDFTHGISDAIEALRTPCAPWNLKTIGLCMIGTWTILVSPTTRNKLNFHA
jgi:glutaminyl-tRNA synthetase (EC 6.1.1.18)